MIPYNDRLDKMFDLQDKLQKRLGTWDKFTDNIGTVDESMRQQFVNQMILAMVEESVEIMRETSYKNPAFVPFGWKKGQVTNREKVLDEVVDLWHFMMNICLAYDFTADDFYNSYEKKNRVNHVRQDNNY